MVNAYACNRIQHNLETLQQIAEILQGDLKDLITDKDDVNDVLWTCVIFFSV